MRTGQIWILGVITMFYKHFGSCIKDGSKDNYNTKSIQQSLAGYSKQEMETKLKVIDWKKINQYDFDCLCLKAFIFEFFG